MNSVGIHIVHTDQSSELWHGEKNLEIAQLASRGGIMNF